MHQYRHILARRSAGKEVKERGMLGCLDACGAYGGLLLEQLLESCFHIRAQCFNVEIFDQNACTSLFSDGASPQHVHFEAHLSTQGTMRTKAHDPHVINCVNAWRKRGNAWAAPGEITSYIQEALTWYSASLYITMKVRTGHESKAYKLEVILL
jgi:hypothetical protein